MLALLSLLFGFVKDLIAPIFSYESTVDKDKATVEVASIQTMGAVEQKWWFVALCIPMLAIPVELYLLKAMAWDKVLGPILGFHSSTAPLGADLHIAFLIILGGIFLNLVTK